MKTLQPFETSDTTRTQQHIPEDLEFKTRDCTSYLQLFQLRIVETGCDWQEEKSFTQHRRNLHN
jgi:transposase